MTRKKQGSFNLHVLTDTADSPAAYLIDAILPHFEDRALNRELHFWRPGEHQPPEFLGKLRGRRNLVVYALADPGRKRQVDEICDRKSIPHFDLTGSLVQFIADHTGLQPEQEHAKLHNTGAGYSRRIAAMEFTARHDDSRRIGTAGKADIVILGLSRVSKSPTSTWLGAMGFKVANVAISPETGLPPEVGRIRAKKIIGFTIQPRALVEIRSKRLQEYARRMREVDVPLPSAYTDLRAVIREVMWAEKIFREHDYPVLDVTGRTIEESGAETLALLGITHPGDRGG